MSLLPTNTYANPSTALFSPPAAYGSFSSTATQVIPAGIASPAVFDTADITPVGFPVPLVQPNIRVGVSGVYKVLASAQCDKTTVGAGDLEMFLQIGLNPVPNSTTRIQINQNTESVMTVEWIVELEKGDDVFVMFFSSVVGMQILAVPAALTVPAIPSIILTLVKIA